MSATHLILSIFSRFHSFLLYISYPSVYLNDLLKCVATSQIDAKTVLGQYLNINGEYTLCTWYISFCFHFSSLSSLSFNLMSLDTIIQSSVIMRNGGGRKWDMKWHKMGMFRTNKQNWRKLAIKGIEWGKKSRKLMMKDGMSDTWSFVAVSRLILSWWMKSCLHILRLLRHHNLSFSLLIPSLDPSQVARLSMNDK